jgi:thiamine biosynthesis lipoprotein
LGALVRLGSWVLPFASVACGTDSTSPAPTIHVLRGPTMGSSYEVKYVAARERPDVAAAVTAELAAIDQTFSNWRDDSEIAKVNQHVSTAPLPVSPRFAEALTLALQVAAASDGAFDPTVKPLLDVFRAAKQQPGQVVDGAELVAALPRVGWRLVQLQARDGVPHVRKELANVSLDLDGLVAGLACDRLAAQLAALGIADCYLEITGEVLCRGQKPGGVPWRIGVVDPAADVAGGDTAIRSLPLRDAALCTSGDYRNAIAVDGQRTHHVFDPRTGRNAEHRVVSASILAPRAAVADALGTAALVLGPDGVRRLWPQWRELGAQGALLLEVGADGELVAVEIDWPGDD